MPRMSQITNDQLKDVRAKLLQAGTAPIRAWHIRQELLNTGISLDESTIRGRFIEMGEPLSGMGGVRNSQVGSQPTPAGVAQPPPQPKMRELPAIDRNFQIQPSLMSYIPDSKVFDCYIERSVDKRLGIHYDSGKYPITQGKQGTGKTFSHMYYAYKNQLPFFLYSGYEDFRLQKYFGDKTIINGSIKFQEGILVMAIQNPSVILFDEVNAISNANTFDFHALLQNRELFVKDADDGKGKIYRLHPQCRIGFAQNPKSAKYIGGNIKPSNFLGRCTYITYPEFTKKELRSSLAKKFTSLTEDEIRKFIDFYRACCEAIDKAEIPADISIRQLHNLVSLYTHGLPLDQAIEDGMTSILEAISQPKSKEAFFRLAQSVWKDMMNKSINETTGQFNNFLFNVIAKKGVLDERSRLEKNDGARRENGRRKRKPESY
jgi:hypothetical protein